MDLQFSSGTWNASLEFEGTKYTKAIVPYLILIATAMVIGTIGNIMIIGAVCAQKV